MHAKTLHTDLLLFDTVSLGPDEALSLRLIRRAAPRTRVLLLIEQPGAGTVEEMLRSRCHGFLLANCPLEVYVRAIRAVVRGDIWIPRALLANALSDILDRISRGVLSDGDGHTSTPDVSNPCTRREQQVLELVTQGLTNKGVARQLGITEDTVKKHLQHAYGKLGVRRRTLVMLSRLRPQLTGVSEA